MLFCMIGWQKTIINTKMNDNDIWSSYTRGIKQLKSKQVVVSEKSVKFRTNYYSLRFVLDLHGYDLASAHTLVNNFIYSHAEQKSKSIIIITGKSGVIKQEFEIWMNLNKKIKRIMAINTGSYRLYLK